MSHLIGVLILCYLNVIHHQGFFCVRKQHLGEITEFRFVFHLKKNYQNASKNLPDSDNN